VPEADMAEWQGFLDGLHYRYVDESANPAYQLFLGAAQAGLVADPLPALA